MIPMRRHSDTPAGPMRRREDELEELLEHGSRNFRRYRRRAMVAFAVLTLACSFAIYRQGESADQAALAAAQAKVLAQEIQDQRRDSIRSNCIAQNKRNAVAIETLDRLIAKIPPGLRRVRAEAGRVGTLLLIEALQPRQNCPALVRRSVKTP